jgi:hypothetical protein
MHRLRFAVLAAAAGASTVPAAALAARSPSFVTPTTTIPRIVQRTASTTTTVTRPVSESSPPFTAGDRLVIGELAGRGPDRPGPPDDLASCVDCLAITSGVAYLVGVDPCPPGWGDWDVYLEVTTNRPATIGIEVLEPGPYGIYGDELVTIWGATFHCLDSCRTYPARAVAEDADGNVRWGFGSFTIPCTVARQLDGGGGHAEVSGTGM